MLTDIQITDEFLTIICGWLAHVANKSRRRGKAIEAEAMRDVLLDVIGNKPTHATFKALQGGQLIDELDAWGMKVPRNTIAVFEGFAKDWSPTTPRCEVPACGLPAIRPLADHTGVETLAEGVVCPWCRDSNVRSFAFKTAKSWVTGQPISDDQEYDITAVHGAELPLQDWDLRQRAHRELLDCLDAEQLTISDWLRYLLHVPGNPYGIESSPLPVLRSLGAESVVMNMSVTKAQVLRAKKALAGKAEPVPACASAPAQPGFGALPPTRPDRIQLHALISKMPASMFETMLFKLGVPMEDLPGGNAPQSTKAIHLIQHFGHRIGEANAILKIHDAYLATWR